MESTALSATMKQMGVVRARIQTSEEIYERLWSAISSRTPLAAIYDRRPRRLCPHRLGTTENGELRVLCYQYAGGSESGLGPDGAPENWRCLAVEKLSRVEFQDDEWRTAPNYSRPANCIVNPHIDVADYPEQPQKGQ